MAYRKYKCPYCGKYMANVRYSEEAISLGVTIKCQKCRQIVEIFIKNEKFLQKAIDK